MTGPRGGTDLVAELKGRGRRFPEPKTLTTISQYPNSLKWTVELLARRANQSHETTTMFLLARGLPLLWRAGGTEIRRARAHVLAHGSTDDRYWFDTCPPVEVLTGTGSNRHVVRVGDEFRSEAGLLASTLGLPLGHILTIAMIAGLVGADIVPLEYRPAFVQTLVRFRELLGRRAARARGIVDATPETDEALVEADWALESDFWGKKIRGDE